MLGKKSDQGRILQDAFYGTGGIPKPEVGAVSVGRTRRRNEQNFFEKIFSPRKIVRSAPGKLKKPGFFENLFSGNGFKKRKGIDGF
ncbi:MAG: hypothetical protein WCX82_04055 [archaeon]|jgi:hypothetical protein